jgi:hypothetical protein
MDAGDVYIRQKSRSILHYYSTFPYHMLLHEKVKIGIELAEGRPWTFW